MLNAVDRFSTSLNAFCATGEGGGIDPSCSPGESAKPGFHDTLASAKAWGEKHGIRVVESVSGTSVSRDQINYVNAQVAKVPAKAMEIVAKAGSRLEIVGGSSVTDHPDNAHMKGIAPRGWESTGKTWDDVPGMGASKPGSATIISARAMLDPQAHGSANLVLHEHAHTIDLFARNERNDPLSRQDDWSKIHQSQKWSSSYEKKFPEEAWAESFAKMYNGERTRKELPVTVRSYFLDKFGDSEPQTRNELGVNQRRYVGKSAILVPLFNEEGQLTGDMVVAPGEMLPNY